VDTSALDIRALKKSCIHIARPDGRMIPFESFNLFYRDEREHLLETIRGELDLQRGQRLAAVPLPAGRIPIRPEA
jgi:hypothetical protein